MIIYEATKIEFINDVADNIDEKLSTLLQQRANLKVSKSEINSWQSSLLHMHLVLNDSSIPDDCGIAIEYKVPNTSKRVDVIVTGYDQHDKGNAVIVELKQWSEILKVENEDAIVQTVINRGMRSTTHPSYQAWSYASLIKDYNEKVMQENIQLIPCTYLHNYKEQINDPLLDKVYQPYIELAPVFLKGDAYKLREFISTFIKKGDQKKIIYHIDHGKIKPSKSLQDSVKNMINGHQEFIMIDNQKVVFEKAKTLASHAKRTRKKQVLIVNGGPGTGKTVLAINLLSEILNQDNNVLYVTKNSAPREVFIKKLKQGKIRNAIIDNLFSGSGRFTTTAQNSFDCLIVDEAHRLNEKSGMFSNLGENQIKEIIHSSMFSIFFIDEKQQVTIKDNGSISEIEKWASHYKANIHYDNLDSQFRCNGSDGYLLWLDYILDIETTANATFDHDFDYEFEVLDNPNELRRIIEEKNRVNNKARLIAGYCWPWDKGQKSNPDYFDIQIPQHNFQMSWNLGNTATWAIDEKSVNQVGCIHTSQGLEFDYVGIIIGEDLRYENGKIVTDYSKRAKTDTSLKGIKSMMKTNPEQAEKLADKIIKNTYRTLLSRGQKGCYVYCVDQGLAQYLRQHL